MLAFLIKCCVLGLLCGAPCKTSSTCSLRVPLAPVSMSVCVCVCVQHAERLSASRLIMVGADEWAKGCVSVKDLSAREQKELPVAEL